MTDATLLYGLRFPASGAQSTRPAGGPEEPEKEGLDALLRAIAIAVAVLVFTLLALAGCASGGGPKVYVSDPDVTCPGASQAGAAVRGQAGECLPYRATKGAYIVFPKDVDLWILQARQRLGLPDKESSP